MSAPVSTRDLVLEAIERLVRDAELGHMGTLRHWGTLCVQYGRRVHGLDPSWMNEQDRDQVGGRLAWLEECAQAYLGKLQAGPRHDVSETGKARAEWASVLLDLTKLAQHGHGPEEISREDVEAWLRAQVLSCGGGVDTVYKTQHGQDCMYLDDSPDGARRRSVLFYMCDPVPMIGWTLESTITGPFEYPCPWCNPDGTLQSKCRTIWHRTCPFCEGAAWLTDEYSTVGVYVRDEVTA